MPRPTSTHRLARLLALAWLLVCSAAAAQALDAAAPGQRLQGLLGTAAQAPPAEVIRLAAQVVASGDARGRAYAVIDKRAARLWVFGPSGQPLADSPVLVGQATGDVAPPDIGTRPLRQVRAHEKITPAGRFDTEPGENLRGEDIVWLDYDSALSLHRVRDVPGEGRPARIGANDARRRRISYGCVNVPAGFYDRHIQPWFARQAGVVYILPETLPLARVFGFAPD